MSENKTPAKKKMITEIIHGRITLFQYFLNKGRTRVSNASIFKRNPDIPINKGIWKEYMKYLG